MQSETKRDPPKQKNSTCFTTETQLATQAVEAKQLMHLVNALLSRMLARTRRLRQHQDYRMTFLVEAYFMALTLTQLPATRAQPRANPHVGLLPLAQNLTYAHKPTASTSERARESMFSSNSLACCTALTLTLTPCAAIHTVTHRRRLRDLNSGAYLAQTP